MSDLRDAAAPAQPTSGRAASKTSKTRQRLLLLAKVLVAALAFTYVFTRQSWAELTAALGRITPAALATATALLFLCVATATFRWQSVLRAYGAVRLPPVLGLMRVYFVGQFYNTYLPGAVGGDFVRGVATRNAFREGGATTSVAVVFVERAVGVLGLLLAAALAVPFEVESHVARDFLPYLSLGLLGVIAMIAGITQAHRLTHYMPKAIASVMRGLPVLERYGAFALACLISLTIQLGMITAGHVVVSSIHPGVHFSDSMLVVPLAAAAAFFPLSVAGAGPRDAVLVSLYALVGVPRPAAAATALVLLFMTLVVGASGGLLQLLAPLTLDQPRSDR